MLNGLTEKVAKDLGKKKDVWLLETLEKHELIKSSNITSFDVFWLTEEIGVRIVNTIENKTQIYLGETILGEWDNNYQIEQVDDNTYRFNAKYWN